MLLERAIAQGDSAATDACTPGCRRRGQHDLSFTFYLRPRNMLGVLCILPDSACHTVSESARGDSGAGSQPTALSVPLSRPLTALDVSVLRSVAQLCPTLCDPTDGSPPGSSVRGSLQVGILAGAAMPSSRGSSRPGDQTQVSCTAGGFFTI